MGNIFKCLCIPYDEPTYTNLPMQEISHTMEDITYEALCYDSDVYLYGGMRRRLQCGD